MVTVNRKMGNDRRYFVRLLTVLTNIYRDGININLTLDYSDTIPFSTNNLTHYLLS